MNPCEDMRLWYLDIFRNPGKLVTFYRKDKYETWMTDKFLEGMCTLEVPRNLFLSKYKEMTPIEELDQEEKYRMKKTVHEMFPGRTVQFKLEAVKIIYTFGTLL